MKKKQRCNNKISRSSEGSGPDLHKAKRIKVKTRQFSVAPVSSCLPPPADLSPFSSSSSPPPTLPLPPSPNRSCEEEPLPTGVGPRNRKCPLARRRQPHVTILLHCSACTSPVTAPPCGHVCVWNAIRHPACCGGNNGYFV